jgi:hypothetical protein
MRASGTASDPAIGLASSFDPGDGLRPRYNTLGALKPVWPRPVAGERTLGVSVGGQSTIADWSSGALYTALSARSHQANILDGRVYPMADPVFGCDGTGGSPSSALGDLLIALGKYDRVTVANAAFGSTTSAQWANSTAQPAQGLKAAWALLKAHGYTNIVHIHQQGEADASAGTSQATMLANIQALDLWRRAYGINCPMYVSKTTFPFGGWVTSDPNPVNWTPGAAATLIRNAQAAAVNGTTILAGPDTDLIRGSAYGRTSAHPTLQAGPLAIAAQWAALL